MQLPEDEMQRDAFVQSTLNRVERAMLGAAWWSGLGHIALGGDSEDGIPGDHDPNLCDPRADVEGAATANALLDLIDGLPAQIEVDDQIIRLKWIISQLSQGATTEELRPIPDSHIETAQQIFAGMYFGRSATREAVQLPTESETWRELPRARVKVKSRGYYDSIAVSLAAIQQTTQRVATLEGVVTLIERADLTDDELAVLLHVWGYFAENDMRDAYYIRCNITANSYRKCFSNASSKLAAAAEHFDNHTQTTTTMAQLIEQRANSRRKAEIIHFPETSIGRLQEIERLITDQARAARFAAFKPTHRSLVTEAIRQVNERGILDINELRRVGQLGSDHAVVSIITRALAKLTDPNRLQRKSGARTPTNSFHRDIIEFPPAQARKLLEKNPKLLDVYESLIAHKDGIYSTHGRFHPRHLGLVHDVLFQKTPRQIVENFAQKREITPEECLRLFHEAHSRPKNMQNIAQQLGLSKSELGLWLRRLGLNQPVKKANTAKE